MKTVQSILSPKVQALIKEYNIHIRLGKFLCNDKECRKLVYSFIPEDQQYKFNHRNLAIEKELIPYIYENFHGKKVRVRTTGPGGGEIVDGIIEHLPTRFFINNKNEKIETAHTVSFRREYEDIAYSAPETIALQVNTGDKYTSHLYTSNNIELLD